jgi:hypothetical protein
VLALDAALGRLEGEELVEPELLHLAVLDEVRE